MYYMVPGSFSGLCGGLVVTGGDYSSGIWRLCRRVGLVKITNVFVVKLVILVPGLSHQMTSYYDTTFDLVLCTRRSLLYQKDHVISGMPDSRDKINHDDLGSIGID